MDARITKQRLGNLLSYDWLKMLVTIAIFVFLVVLLFTMTATRVTNAQTFTVYAYNDVTAGRDFNSLADKLKDEDVLSYDILETTTEKFSADSQYDLYSLRRTTGEGTVMFVSDVRVYETDDDGNPVLDENGDPKIETESALYSLAMGSTVDSEDPISGTLYDCKYYIESCAEYLSGFFEGDWETSNTLDEAAVRASFLERNSGDKRYKNDEAREKGIADERQRILDLRDDYLVVLQCFENGTFKYTEYTAKNVDGSSFTSVLGINLGGLEKIADLAYYTDGEGNQVVSNLNLVILYNNFHEAKGLRFEPVTFLRYLYEEYGA